MSVAIRSVGFLSGGTETQVSVRDAFPEAPERFASVSVRTARLDLRAILDDPPERLGRMDRLCQLSLAAAQIALREAGARPAAPVAVVHESGLSTIGTNDVFFRKLLRRGPRGVDPKRFPYTSPNAAAGEIAIAFGLTGPNVALVPGLVGGLAALATAVGLLRNGHAASALVVGADALSPASVAWLASSGSSLGPPGEGAVALLLEPGEGNLELRVEEGLDPGAPRSVHVDPPDSAVADAGDLPGACGLLALARAARAGRAVSVRVAGQGGLFAAASLEPPDRGR